jgi:hypothetical protein
LQCRPGRGQHEGDSEFFGSHLNTLDAETLDQIFSMFDGGLGCLKRRIHCYPDDFKFLRLVIVTGNINRTHPAFIWLISIDRRCDSRSIIEKQSDGCCHTNLIPAARCLEGPLRLTPRWRLATSGTLRL